MAVEIVSLKIAFLFLVAAMIISCLGAHMVVILNGLGARLIPQQLSVCGCLVLTLVVAGVFFAAPDMAAWATMVAGFVWSGGFRVGLIPEDDGWLIRNSGPESNFRDLHCILCVSISALGLLIWVLMFAAGWTQTCAVSDYTSDGCGSNTVCQRDLFNFPLQCICPTGGWGQTCKPCPPYMHNLGDFNAGCVCDPSSAPRSGFDGSISNMEMLDHCPYTDPASCKWGNFSVCMTCPIGHFHRDDQCIPCPEGSSTKHTNSDHCDLGINLSLHWAVAGCCAILCAVCPVIASFWLRFRWPMIFDVAVSSIDFGSDLFWVFTDRFYDVATLVFGFLFLFGTSLGFVLGFYVRGFPPLVMRLWIWRDVVDAEKDAADADWFLPFCCLFFSLPVVFIQWLATDFTAWFCGTWIFQKLHDGHDRLASKGMFQLFETVDGELLYVLANMGATMGLILALCLGWVFVCLEVLLGALVCLGFILPALFVLGMSAFILNVTCSVLIIIGLILLGVVLNMTRLLAARPISKWYGKLWSRVDEEAPVRTGSPSPSRSRLREVAAELDESPSASPPKTRETGGQVPTPKGEPPQLPLSARARDLDEVVWNWLVITEILGETLPMLVLNFVNIILLSGAGLQEASFATVASMVSSAFMLIRLGFRYFYFVVWKGMEVKNVPTKLSSRNDVSVAAVSGVDGLSPPALPIGMVSGP